MSADPRLSRELGQKTVIVPRLVHDQLTELQTQYRAELGRNVTFGEIIERSLNLLAAMRSGRDA